MSMSIEYVSFIFDFLFYFLSFYFFASEGRGPSTRMYTSSTPVRACVCLCHSYDVQDGLVEWCFFTKRRGQCAVQVE